MKPPKPQTTLQASVGRGPKPTNSLATESKEIIWFEQAKTTTVGPCADDGYDVEDVVEKMLRFRDRRIPGSVYKPHNDTVILI